MINFRKYYVMDDEAFEKFIRLIIKKANDVLMEQREGNSKNPTNDEIFEVKCLHELNKDTCNKIW